MVMVLFFKNAELAVENDEGKNMMKIMEIPLVRYQRVYEIPLGHNAHTSNDTVLSI